MLNFLFKKETKVDKSAQLTEFVNKLKEIYSYNSISDERKNYLNSLLETNGYLPYPHIRALEEISDAEALYCLEYKWRQNGVYNGNSEFHFDNPSVLARNNIQNSDWIKKEGHNIKLINLAGLGNGNEKSDTGKLADWLKQLAILPTGNLENNIFSTTIYLIPFHPREFGCAYLPMSSSVSPNLEDKNITEKTGFNADGQVKLFIEMAQLAGHPVIYDILPQTARYSKIVLANPECARWFDINALISEIEKNVDEVCKTLKEKYSQDDINIVKDLYKKSLRSGIGDLAENYKAIYHDIDEALVEKKKYLSNAMLEKDIQVKLHRKARNIISSVINNNSKKLKESDITNQGDVIQKLIEAGMWPSPGGAWCSAGVPVFNRMSDCGSYPTFKHYNYKGEDVTQYANLDCQTPYYFVNLETGEYNNNVIDFFINYMKDLQADFNFDGFRVDHIDHIVDEVSEKDGVPISYRAPRKVLGKLNTALKNKIPYFGTLAEYMLWDNYLKEYHEDMNFDLLWGSDIVAQSDKTPERIANDNLELTNYNTSSNAKNCLSILKTYNNQDGEFSAIDRYPGQLGEQGALFKWFKYKFLPGGKFAQRPVMYIDGDESFTTKGIESVIGAEISMPREKDYEFYAKFDAIDRFVKNSPIISGGEAHIIRQDEDGFVVWQISKEGLKTSILVAANYHNPSEKFWVWEGSEQHIEVREGREVFDKNISLSCDYKITGQYNFDGDNYVEEKFQTPTDQLMFSKIMPAEFKFYTVEQV